MYLIKQVETIKDGETVSENINLVTSDIETARKNLKELNRCERVLLVYEEVGTI